MNDSLSDNALTAGADAFAIMTMLGKTAAALAVIIALIMLGALVLRRINGSQGFSGCHLKVVGGVAIGHKERVVIVEVDKTWLVLGVGGGQVTKLHELQAPSEQERTDTDKSRASDFSRLLGLARAGRTVK